MRAHEMGNRCALRRGCTMEAWATWAVGPHNGEPILMLKACFMGGSWGSQACAHVVASLARNVLAGGHDATRTRGLPPPLWCHHR